MSSGVVHDVLFLLNVLPYSSSTRSNVHYVHLRGGRWPVKRVARRSHMFMVTVTCHLALPGLLLLHANPFLHAPRPHSVGCCLRRVPHHGAHRVCELAFLLRRPRGGEERGGGRRARERGEGRKDPPSPRNRISFSVMLPNSMSAVSRSCLKP